MENKLTVVQAAKRLGIDPSQLRRYILDGRLPAEAITPRLYLIDEAALAAFAELPRKRGWRKGKPRKPADSEPAQ